MRFKKAGALSAVLKTSLAPRATACAMTDMTSYLHAFAEISSTGDYRYQLTRTWRAGDRRAMFIGLNPSTADGRQDDPTIRKCVALAERWGFDGLIMCNLFAWRATQPADMLKAADPIGGLNDRWLMRSAWDAELVVACWGTDGAHMHRDRHVEALMDGRCCVLKVNQDGSPAHPLYLKGDVTPELWRGVM